MKMNVLLGLAFFIATSTAGQNQKRNNPAMDSLKRSVQQVGNLFRKAVPIPVMILSIDSADRNTASLLLQLQQAAGVKKIKTTYADTSIAVLVPFKGKGPDLWQSLPAGTHQLFTLVQSDDSTMTIRYKYNTKPAVATTPKTAKSNTGTPMPKQPPATQGLSPAAALLFKNVKTKYPAAVKNKLVTDMQFILSKDGQTFYTPDGEEYPFGASVYPTDLNADGKEELFVLFGNSYTSGMTGSNIVLYIPDKSGNLIANLGFPGTLPYAFATGNMGYPDLLIGGPGFEFPIWRWNGKTYDFYKKIKEKDWLKLKYTPVEDLSKKYQDSVK